MGELDFLTQETMSYSNKQSHFDFDEAFTLDAENKEVQSYPESPGIIYHIYNSGPTFSLKGYVTDSIADSFETLEQGEKSRFRALKLEENEIDKVQYYELESIEMAEMVYDQLFNKRYPNNEDILCNISDPGFSWWYTKNDSGFRINFKSHKFNESGERVRLGPIGDVVIANFRLGQLEKILKEHLPLNEYHTSEKQFILKSTDNKHPLLMELMDIFEKGELLEDSALLSEAPLNLKLYLLELAAIRKFWLYIETTQSQNAEIIN